MNEHTETSERFAPFTDEEFFDAIGRVLEIAKTSDEPGLDYSPMHHIELMLTVAERMKMDTLLDKTRLVSLITGAMAWVARRDKKEIALLLGGRALKLARELLADECVVESPPTELEILAEKARELETRAEKTRDFVNRVFAYVDEGDHLEGLKHIKPLEQIVDMAALSFEAGPWPALFGLAAWITANHRPETRPRLDELDALAKSLH